MKRTTIKSLVREANEIESADYMDILILDVINGNYSQLNERMGSMSKKDLLQVLTMSRGTCTAMRATKAKY